MLTWASPFNICCFLDNQGYQATRLQPGHPSDPPVGPATPPPVFECLLAVGAVEHFTASPGRAFTDLQAWAADRKEWLFGHFAYDLATETEPSAPAAPPADPIGFPALFFFVPEIVITLQQDSIRIGSLGPAPEAIWQAIGATAPLQPAPQAPIAFEPRFTPEEYLETIRALRNHILRGDCYEINFCQEFYAQTVSFDPWAAWQALSQVSPNPFSAFYRIDKRFLLCASPERFLKRTGTTLLSQPIKGTAPRVPDDAATDLRTGLALAESSKDRAENVMVVDLVRNDLSRICRPGSVRVNELFGIYAFPQVYQMISAITGESLPGLHWSEAIRATFPMGSMTGAPKNNVVRLIARYERSRRGLFSGTLGYVNPDGDFDFNVVIRSLLYREDTGYLSYQVGSGITYNSDPAAEYEECLLKAQGIRKALGIK
jgi:para-aminobenzoate synthetase component I